MKATNFEEDAVRPNHGTGTKKILLVDDSSTSRMTARMLLSGHESYVLTSACDGQEGVEKAIAELPNLILMDIEMPRMNGIDACRLLKQNKTTKNIPVVLLTMRGEEQFVRQAYASGCNEFLTKPVNEQKLSHGDQKISWLQAELYRLEHQIFSAVPTDAKFFFERSYRIMQPLDIDSRPDTTADPVPNPKPLHSSLFRSSRTRFLKENFCACATSFMRRRVYGLRRPRRPCWWADLPNAFDTTD